jgi:hypothetical protein
MYEISSELFEEHFREGNLDEFIERQLNEFNSLTKNSMPILEYEVRFMELLRYALHFVNFIA